MVRRDGSLYAAPNYNFRGQYAGEINSALRLRISHRLYALRIGVPG